MAKYADGLKISITRYVKAKKNPKTAKQAYARIRKKLTDAMKEYEEARDELLNLQDGVGEISPQQKSLSDSFERVRRATAAMILDLDTLQANGWEPE